MRKIIVFSMISIDGVMQAPGGAKEDASGGFKYGGWTAAHSDDVFREVLKKELAGKSDYLLGRKTYSIWAPYWPHHGHFWPGINEGIKYVFSKKLKKTDPMVTGWKESVVVRTVADIKKLKQTKGRDIQVWGSSQLIQLLLKHDLVDEIKLKIYPITLGKGKKLFTTGAIPAAFKLTESIVTPKGVIIAAYKRAGDIKTGSMEDV